MENSVISKLKIYANNLKKTTLMFMLAGTISGVTMNTVDSSLANNVYAKEQESKTNNENKSKKWKSYNDRLEYRVLADGSYEFRQHDYNKKYNDKTKKDTYKCKECGHKHTEKHKHDFTKWKYNNEKKRYERDCEDCEIKEAKKAKNSIKIKVYDKNGKYIKTITSKKAKSKNKSSSKGSSSGGGGSSSSYSTTYTYPSTTGTGGNANTSSNNTNNQTSTTTNHIHNFKNSVWVYADENREKRECSTHDGAYQYRLGHNYGSYTYNNTTGLDEATCSTCGHVKTKTHVEEHIHTPGEATYESVNDNIHNKFIKCKDDGLLLSATQEAHHYNTPKDTDWSRWVINPENAAQEIRTAIVTCSDCKHQKTLTETRVHTHNYQETSRTNPINIEANDEKHKITITKTCALDNLTITEDIYENHNYKLLGNWSAWIIDPENPNKEIRTATEKCETCGHTHTLTERQDHVHDYQETSRTNPINIEANDKQHKITITKTCALDNLTITEDIYENHIYNIPTEEEWSPWTINDNATEETRTATVYCECGHTKTLTETRNHIHTHIENAPVEYLSATNEEEYVCNQCNKIYTVPHESHGPLIESGKRTYVKGNLEVCYTVDMECKICHTVITEQEEHQHNFDDNNYCNQCKKTKNKIALSTTASLNKIANKEENLELETQNEMLLPEETEENLPIEDPEEILLDPPSEESAEENIEEETTEIEEIYEVEEPLESFEETIEIEESYIEEIDEDLERIPEEFEDEEDLEEVEEEIIEEDELTTAKVTITDEIATLRNLEQILKECYTNSHNKQVAKQYVKAI